MMQVEWDIEINLKISAFLSPVNDDVTTAEEVALKPRFLRFLKTPKTKSPNFSFIRFFVSKNK